MSEVEKELMPSSPDDPNYNRRTIYSTLKTTTTITDTLHETIDDLDSLIAKRKAELAKRLKDGDKATFVPISPEKKPSPTKREENDMAAVELIKSLREQIADAKKANLNTTSAENDDWRGRELKNCFEKIASLEEQLKEAKIEVTPMNSGRNKTPSPTSSQKKRNDNTDELDELYYVIEQLEEEVKDREDKLSEKDKQITELEKKLESFSGDDNEQIKHEFIDLVLERENLLNGKAKRRQSMSDEDFIGTEDLSVAYAMIQQSHTYYRKCSWILSVLSVVALSFAYYHFVIDYHPCFLDEYKITS